MDRKQGQGGDVGIEIRDPDPFTIALGIFGAISGGGAFLEARRARHEAERLQRDAFRAAWYGARRTVIHFKRLVDEFETYVLEDGYGRSAFRIGAVRISVDLQRHRAMRRLTGQAMITASHMADDLDELSNYLGAADQPAVDDIIARLSEYTIPESYRDVIRLARQAIDLYADFLDGIGEREGFATDADEA